MKKTLRSKFILFLLLSSMLAMAQPVLPNFDLSTVPCPNDSSIEILQFDNWELYQTENDLPDGPRLINCASAQDIDGIYWDNNDFDVNHLLFFRCKALDSLEVLLNTNGLYYLNWLFWNSANGFNIESICGGSTCSKVVMDIEIPDSTNTGFDIRHYETSFKDSENGEISSQSCIPVEKFSHNRLSSFYLQLKLIEDQTVELPYYIYEQFRELLPWEEYQDDGFIQETSPNMFDINFGFDFWVFGGLGYLRHEGDEYPSNSHIYYHDITPSNNTPNPLELELTIDESETLSFQPFTQFRAGLVADSDTARHFLTVVNLGGDICLPGIIDIQLINKHISYEHHAGYVHFEGKSSCMLLADGGTLRVAEGSTFYYGNDGHGMMLLRPGANIEIEKNASLIVDNTWMMSEWQWDETPGEIYLTLPKGSKLAFGSEARLKNSFSRFQTIRLNVLMQGGELDDSLLPEADKLLINRIYDSNPNSLDDNIRINGNPVSDGLLDISIMNEQTRPFAWSLYNNVGQPLRNGVIDCPTGASNHDIALDELPNGLYYLNFLIDNEQVIKKIIVAR